MALLKTKTNKEKLLTVAFLEAIASLQVTFSLTQKLALVRKRSKHYTRGYSISCMDFGLEFNKNIHENLNNFSHKNV